MSYESLNGKYQINLIVLQEPYARASISLASIMTTAESSSTI